MANNEEQPAYRHDPLFLHNSDHPGMVLTTTKLTGMNFIPWSRSIKIALISKMKIGFINGKSRKPDPDDPSYAQWERCDNMVFSWILNSIQSDLAEAFLYATSSEELWNELEERFGESNGPLIYQIEKKIADIRQNNDFVGAYFTKLKKLWDELANVTDPAVCECNGCTCDAKKKLAEAEQKRRLVKFLMGLNEGFDTIRGQIMLIEPLPTASNACSLVQQIERQRNISGIQTLGSELAAYAGTDNIDSHNMALYAGKGPGQRQNGYNKTDPRKNRKMCEYCKEPGHFKDQCFKLIGYPEWFKGPKENATLNAYAHLASKFCTIASTVLDSHSAEICCVGRNIVDWIVDTGASDHMTPFEDILFDVYELPKPITVTLPDGNHKAVNKAGKVVLSSSLILMDVLYVPDFQFSLISIHSDPKDTSSCLPVPEVEEDTQNPVCTDNLSIHSENAQVPQPTHSEEVHPNTMPTTIINDDAVS
ncbi:unnamed protein product [Cuscuta campestris]|uniref:Retrotransposon Copia-like N-terminal domain-containing protein n=1 Tax=Cuscuta campestris TaxID=132261 RepID=A0A484MZ88_9ASTE|nr:unnamed protein product [Cuscuta campestris]